MRSDHRLTIPGIAAAAAETFPDAVGLIAGGEVWTFSQLYHEARRAASAFLESGLEAGEAVALWAPNRREWVVAALGAQIAGAAIVPINTRLKARETADILRRARVT